jgi:thymidine kinase
MKRGKVVAVIGCMFAGKSTFILLQRRRYEIAKKVVVSIKPSSDTRYNVKTLTTHDDHEGHAFEDILSCSSLNELKETHSQILEKAQVIQIEEINQFMMTESDAIEWREQIEKWADAGKIVQAFVLQASFQRREFGYAVRTIIPCADEIIHLRAVCSFCSEADASHSVRLALEDTREGLVLGDSDKYASACRACYNDFHRGAEKK